jgi:hypothetical protein
MKKLVVVFLCLCAVSGAWASEKKEEKTEQQKTYRLKYEDQFIDMSQAALKLASGLLDLVETYGEDTGVREGNKDIINVDVTSFLVQQKINFDDFKEFVKFAHNELDFKTVPLNRLIKLIKIADYVGAVEGKEFKPARNLLKQLCTVIASQITDKDYDDLIHGRGILAQLENALPQTVLDEYVHPLVTKLLKEPSLLWEESISDQGIMSCIAANGMIATAQIKNEEGFFVAKEVVLADPLEKEKKIILQGKFSFDNREIFNVILLPKERLGIITWNQIQIFDLKTSQRVSFIDKPIKKENWPIFSKECYLSQNLAVVFDDGTIVCTADEGLFAWQVGEKEGRVIKLNIRKMEKSEGNMATLISLPLIDTHMNMRVRCVTALARISDTYFGVLFNQGTLEIWNRQTWKFERKTEQDNWNCPAFGLVALPDLSVAWQGTKGGYRDFNFKHRFLFWNWQIQQEEPKNETDFFPLLGSPKDGILIRDLLYLADNFFAMNTTEFRAGTHLEYNDFVKIGSSLRDCIAIPIQKIQYKRFSDFRLFDVDLGRIMLEQHDREKKVIHRKMWKVCLEGLTFKQSLFFKEFMRTSQKSVKKIEGQPLPTKQEEKEGFFKRLKKSLFNVVPESIKETEGEEPSGLGMNIEETNFERIFGDGVIMKAFALCLDQNTEKNTEFLKQLKITEQEAKILFVLQSLNELLDESVTTSEQVRAGMAEVTKLLKGIKFDELPGYVRRELTEKKRRAEEKELTLETQESYTKKHEEEEGK